VSWFLLFNLPSIRQKGHMMKKEAQLTLRVYQEILQTVSCYVGLSLKEQELNLQQIANLLASRGLRSVYLDFPSIAQLVDRSLSDGHIDFSLVRRVLGSSKGTNYPKIFRFLFKEIYTEDGILRDSDPNYLLFLRQFCLMFKKIVRDAPQSTIDEALAGFIDLDNEIGENFSGWFPIWEDPSSLTYEEPLVGSVLFAPNTRFDASVQRVGRKLPGVDKEYLRKQVSVFRLLGSSMGVPQLDDLVPAHGTGAVSGMSWGDKYSFPDWSSKLATHFPLEDFALVNYGNAPTGAFPDIDIPVKILPVPKTMKGPRIIGAESVARMFCQQSLMAYMRKRMSRITYGSVNITDQSRSQKRAVRGSVDGSLATIDLSSASDRLSCFLVEELFSSNPQFLGMLSATRASTYVINQDVYRMRKFSHQGSAVTFPVQSLAYYAICVGVSLHFNGVEPTPKNVREASRNITVYGDDIIVPTEIYEPLIASLQAWGMAVNVHKSHGSGFFRESCGIDAYKGVDVTPTYIRDLDYDVRKPETVIRFVEVGNNLHKAGYWHASCGLFSCVGIRIPTTSHETVPLARYTFSKGSVSLDLKTRWSEDLHVFQVKALVPSAKGRKNARDEIESLLQYFLEDPTPDSNWASGYYSERPKAALRSKWFELPDMVVG